MTSPCRRRCSGASSSEILLQMVIPPSSFLESKEKQHQGPLGHLEGLQELREDVGGMSVRLSVNRGCPLWMVPTVVVHHGQ